MAVTAEKSGFWKSSYEVRVDDRPVATFNSRTWRGGGTFTLRDGQEYHVVARSFGRRFELCRVPGADGMLSEPLAVADRVGRTQWTITESAHGGVVHRFRRRSFWHGDQELLGRDGEPVGNVRRRSAWRGGAVGELPGLDEPMQVFVVAVVVCMWDAQTAAASSG